MSAEDSSGATAVDRLAARALSLVDVPSESGHEEPVLSAIRAALPERMELLDDADSVVFVGPPDPRAEVPFVVLAGHVDTVPIAGNVPGALDGSAIVGRGAADMKGALAVMLEIARDAERSEGSLDLGLLFFGREELPFGESALLPLFERCPAASRPDLAIVMEPTDNTIQLGCLGNLNATVTVRGRATHSARPWLGDNAIHRAIEALAPIADLPVRDVTIEGLTFREVMSVTSIQGGVAANVIPDRVEAGINYRYAPVHTPQEAETRLAELLAAADVEVRIDGNAPAGPVNIANGLVSRLVEAVGLPVGPKQAWTPVAEFALAGVDAVNFGPGDPQYAHRDDERVEVPSLVSCLETLRAFFGIGSTDDHGELEGTT